MAKITLKRYAKLLAIHAKMDLASLMRDTKFMLLVIFADLISNISSISGVFLLAWKFGSIGGMDRFEVLFMLAYGNMVMGFLNMVAGCSNALFPSRIIGRGQWEHMFIMPLPYPVQLSIVIFPFTGSGNLLSGIVLLCVALNHMELILPRWWLLALLLHLSISMIIVVAMSYLFASLTFYAPVQCEEIDSTVVYSMEHTATFPLSGMPPYLKHPLLTIFPVGLMAWLPTLLLLNRTNAAIHLYPALLAVLLTLAANYFFKKGFRYYVQKGINRYVPGGHRS